MNTRALNLTKSSIKSISSRSLSSSTPLYRSRARFNTIINFTPEKEAWVIERMGRYNRMCNAGVNIIMPFFDKIAYVQNLKEQNLVIQHQQAITADNVVLDISGVLYLRVMDAKKCSYGIENPEDAITQLAMTTMRSAIGHMQLDECFKEREKLNLKIVEGINAASSKNWGIDVLRYEIKDIIAPRDIQRDMEKQAAAERKKRAVIAESEGERDAEINKAEGNRKAIVMAAQAEAEAITLVAEAQANRIRVIGESMDSPSGYNAAMLSTAEEQIKAYSQMAKESTTLIVPNDPTNISGNVATALGTLKAVIKHDDQDHLKESVEKIVSNV